MLFRSAEAVRRADLFIFEFGFASQGIYDPIRTGRQATVGDAKCLDVVMRLLRRATSMEKRTRPVHKRSPRRFVGVNVINNIVWESFSDYVAINYTPFSCQVAAGLPRTVPLIKRLLKKMQQQLF